jgi:hypothetical protein
VSGEERVEDTRTLQPGDRVRVERDPLVGVVTSADDSSFTLDLSGDGSQYWSVLHDGPETKVYRLPNPLPPEPPVAAEVVSRHMDMVFRRTSEGWCSMTARSAMASCPANHDTWHDTWPDVLANWGPVRLLGDPIEAP